MAHIARSAARPGGGLAFDARSRSVQVQTTGTTHRNPSPEELRAFTERMPQCRITEFDNVNVQTRVVSRSSGSTYVVTEDSSSTSHKAIGRAEYARLAKLQDEYLSDKDLIVI